MTMPKKLTAYGGVDALTHALESYVSIYATGGFGVGWVWVGVGVGLGSVGARLVGLVQTR
jgi:hypothetical protein